MASLGFEPTFDFEADHAVVKMMRASVRATNLHIKRSERARTRGARDWTWGKAIESAKPHHAVRAAARTCLAKGAVETHEDMPSIVCHTVTKGMRRKPAIAKLVHGGKVVDDKAVPNAHPDLYDAETTADEGCDGFGTESPQASPLCGPQDVPAELATAQKEWPALPLAAVDVPVVDNESRLSHREVALRFVEESLEEKAAAARMHVKRAASTRATQEVIMWKTMRSKRRQRLLAAKRVRKQSKAYDAPVQACGDAQGGPGLAAASLDFEDDHEVVKMSRAAARHRNLHIKRMERESARRSRWVSLRIRCAQPHHAIRAASRASIAKGTVEAQEDMPSIVRLTKPGDKIRTRMPAIAHAVHGAGVYDDTCEEASHDSNAFVTERDARQPSTSSRQQEELAAPPQPVPDLTAWPCLDRAATAPPPAKPASPQPEKKGFFAWLFGF